MIKRILNRFKILFIWPIIIITIGSIILIITAFINTYFNFPLRYRVCTPSYWNENLDLGFEGFDNVSGVVGDTYIVPNYLHFLRYGNNLQSINFMDAVCILAAFKNQKPDKIFFHTNLPKFTGKYWENLLKIPKFKQIIQFQYIEPVYTIFGQKLSSWYQLWHSSDILRMDILRRFGGIFIDNDVYIVKNLDKFRRFEMSLEIINHISFGTMTLVAHKDARFLKLWLNSYKEYYGHLWYYNAGEKPKIEVLDVRPELIHDAKNEFGVQDLRSELYIQNWENWKSYYTIHTLVRHLHDHEGLLHNSLNLKYPVIFNENNIVNYNVTILHMVLDCCKELLS